MHMPLKLAGTPVIVIGASAGGIDALVTLLAALPPDFPAPIVLVLHRSPNSESLLVPILARHTSLRVREAVNGDVVEPGNVYVARADRHLTITAEGRFTYTDGTPIRHLLSAVNPLFASSAAAYRDRAIAVVLSGAGSDGTDGVQAIKACGGVVIAQDEATSRYFGMPGSAIASGVVDYILPIREIAPALVRITAERIAAASARDDAP